MQSFRALGCCILLLTPCVVGVGVSAKVATAASPAARRGEATTLNNMGLAYFRQKRYQEALRSFQQTLTIKREVKNRRSEARVLNNIGETYSKTGRFQEVLRSYQQALTIERAIKDRKGEVTTLNNIARLHHQGHTN